MSESSSNPVKWGSGAASRVRSSVSRSETTETVLTISDLHFPYQDDAVLASVLKLVKKVKPSRIVLNGDICDFFQISRFSKGPERFVSVADEIAQANNYRRALRDAAPNAYMIESTGNHDIRYMRWLANEGSVIAGLPALKPEMLFLYKELEIQHVGEQGFLLPRGNFLIKHGSMIRKYGGWTAKAEMESAGIATLTGHTHRLSTFRHTNYANLQGIEGGCCCRLDPDYVIHPNWQQGVVYSEHSTKTDAYKTTEVPFLDRQLHLGREKF